MAQYKSVITKEGGDRLAEIIGNDGTLVITSAAAGDGRPLGEPEDRTALVNPLEVLCTVGEKTFLPGEPSQVKIPVQVSNLGLAEPVAIREIGVFATYGGREFLLAYSYLVGEDSDNLLNPSLSTEYADTIHAHDVMLIVTSAQNAHLTVEVSMEGSVTLEQLKEYTYSKSEADQKIAQEVAAAQEEILTEVDGAIAQAGEELKQEIMTDVDTAIEENGSGFFDCTCSYNSGTKVFTLTPKDDVEEMPDIFTARFLTTAAFPEGGTFQILGETFTPKLESSDDPVPEGAFLAGRVITLNFQRGGGAVT